MTKFSLKTALYSLLAIMSSTAASAGVIRHDVDIEIYRRIGDRDEFRCVGRYSLSAESEDYAAGVLVSPRWVLTAAHFPQEKSVWTFGSASYTSVRIIRYPKVREHSSEAQWSGWDLALIELDRPVEGIVPAIRYRKRDEVGALVTKIGYGYVGDGVKGLRTPRMQERLGGHNVIDAAGGMFESRQFGTDVLVLDFDSPLSAETNRFGSPVPLPLEIGGSKGDSGGGVFMQHEGQWQLVGIVSGALNRNIHYGAIAALARISSANPWIDAVIGLDK